MAPHLEGDSGDGKYLEVEVWSGLPLGFFDLQQGMCKMEAKELLIEYSSGKDFPSEKTKADWFFLFGKKAHKEFIEIIQWCHPNVKDDIVHILGTLTIPVDKDLANYLFHEQLHREQVGPYALVAANIFIHADNKFAFTVFARESRKDSISTKKQELLLRCLDSLPENQAVQHVIEALRKRETEEKPLTPIGD